MHSLRPATLWDRRFRLSIPEVDWARGLNLPVGQAFSPANPECQFGRGLPATLCRIALLPRSVTNRPSFALLARYTETNDSAEAVHVREI